MQGIHTELYREIKKLVRGEIREKEPMSRHTSFGIGGPADLWAIPHSREDLFALLDICEKRKISYMIIGRGTNLLVRDGGIKGVVIRLDNACGNLDANKARISAGSGISLNVLVKFAAQHGLEGLEFCVGIPSSVGGALVTNAGAWGKSVGDVLRSVVIYDPRKRETRRVEKDQLVFGYRKSNLASFGVALEAEFKVQQAEPGAIFARMKEYLVQKTNSQPLGFKSAGCIFKNPAGDYAGALVESLGFKGYMCGGAMVSDIHANFILNSNCATASDVLAVIAEIKQRARSEIGIELEEEIQIVGED